MPRHPGHRPPAPPGPGRLLPRAGAPMSIPTARPGPPDAARGSSLARSARDTVRAISRC